MTTAALLTAVAGPLCAVLVAALFAALATVRRVPLEQGGEASAERAGSGNDRA